MSNQCIHEHKELEVPNKILSLVKEANQEEVDEMQKENLAQLKEFSDQLRDLIRSDPSRPPMNFNGFTENFPKVHLSLPNNSNSKPSSDVTLVVKMEDRGFSFSYELRFSQYLQKPAKTIGYTGFLDSLTKLDGCENSLAGVLYSLYLEFVKEFTKISTVEVFDNLLKRYQEEIAKSEEAKDISARVLEMARKSKK